mgnify:CR=1 FL=1
MPIAFVQNLGNLSTSSATSLSGTFGSSTTTGNFIALGSRVGATGRTVTGSDSNSNTYAQAKNQVNSTDGHEGFIHYAMNITGGASHQCTISISGAASTIRITLHEYSGLATSGALDQTNSAQGNSASLDSGNITTLVADELLFGVGTSAGDTTFTVGTNFANGQFSPSASGSQRQAGENRIVSATGTYSAPFSIGGTLQWTCLVASFSIASAALVDNYTGDTGMLIDDPFETAAY